MFSAAKAADANSATGRSDPLRRATPSAGLRRLGRRATPRERRALAELVASGWDDLKRRDAEAVLAALAGPLPPLLGLPPVPITTFFLELLVSAPPVPSGRAVGRADRWREPDRREAAGAATLVSGYLECGPGDGLVLAYSSSCQIGVAWVQATAMVNDVQVTLVLTDALDDRGFTTRTGAAVTGLRTRCRSALWWRCVMTLSCGTRTSSAHCSATSAWGLCGS